MRVLTLNCGSSSVKFSLFETNREKIVSAEDELLTRGLVERIGQKPAFVTIQNMNGEKVKKSVEADNHESAIKIAYDLTQEMVPGEIDAIGHRVVHGGSELNRSRLIDDEVLQKIEASLELAPLHNPHNLAGIIAAKKLLPTLPSVAVFDTGFHKTIPEVAYTYALPSDLCKKNSIRRFGFHGLSHRFIVYRLEHLLNKPREETRIISCHLGNGCSLTAIEEGHSIDTTMGMTPCEGLVMGTRPGDVDPGALLYLMEKEGLTVGEAETLLNRRSGLLGVSGISNDFREVLAARARGNEMASLAIDLFCYRLKKYLGAYYAVLGHVDAIAFTGGIGEMVPEVRSKSLVGLSGAGVKIDGRANEKAVGVETLISSKKSNAQVWVIPANEELVIARDTARCVEDAGRTAWS